MNTDQKKGWALVTGASAGIGEEFCNQLAALSWPRQPVYCNPAQVDAPKNGFCLHAQTNQRVSCR